MSKQKKVTVGNVEQTNKPEIYQEIFSIVEKNKVYFILVAGNQIVKETFATIEEAKQFIDLKPWELIVNTTCLIMDLSKKTTNK